MKYLFYLVTFSICGHAVAQFAHDDSTRYLYDNRTYGTRGFAARTDSDFLFPAYPSARSFSTQSAPHLYWDAATLQLHVFYFGIDYTVGGGTSGPLTGAANGLAVDGSNAILGYAGAAPNLYRAVYIKTGLHSFGINVDSPATATSVDTVIGGYLGIAGVEPNGMGRYFECGYKDPANAGNPVTATFLADSATMSWTQKYQDGLSQSVALTRGDFTMFCGATGFIDVGDAAGINLASQTLADIFMVDGDMQFTASTQSNLQITDAAGLSITDGVSGRLQQNDAMLNVAGGNYAMMYNNGLPFYMTFTSAGGFHLHAYSFYVSDLSLNRTFVVTVPNNIGTPNQNGIWVDTSATFHCQRLASDMDSVLGVTDPFSVSFNPGLGTGLTYSVSGGCASFDVTFTTGTVGVNLDTVLMTITQPQGANSTYSVTYSAKGSQVSAKALQAIVPYYVVSSNLVFTLDGAVAGGPVAQFASNTTYTFSFHVIDHTF